MSWSICGKYFRYSYFSPMLLIKAVTFSTYAFLASSLLVPFFLFHASHLALPFKSNKPGFAGNKRVFESLWRSSFNNNDGWLGTHAKRCELENLTRSMMKEVQRRWPQPHIQYDIQHKPNNIIAYSHMNDWTTTLQDKGKNRNNEKPRQEIAHKMNLN